MTTTSRRDAGRRVALAAALVGIGLLGYAVPDAGGSLSIVLAAAGWLFPRQPRKGES